MNFLGMFGHIDALPFIYGVMIALNLIIFIVKLKKGMLLSAAIDGAVFWGVFQMHGGTMTGSLAALIAATIASLIVPVILRR